MTPSPCLKMKIHQEWPSLKTPSRFLKLNKKRSTLRKKKITVSANKKPVTPKLSLRRKRLSSVLKHNFLSWSKNKTFNASRPISEPLKFLSTTTKKTLTPRWPTVQSIIWNSLRTSTTMLMFSNRKSLEKKICSSLYRVYSTSLELWDLQIAQWRLCNGEATSYMISMELMYLSVTLLISWMEWTMPSSSKPS